MKLKGTLEATALPRGLIALAFEVANLGDEAVRVELFEPFLNFELHAFAAGTPIAVAIPGMSVPLRPIEHRIGQGETLRLVPPVILKFDPSGRTDDPFVWPLVAELQPVEIEATLTLQGVRVGPCRASVIPLP